jgi:hypothetical protein
MNRRSFLQSILAVGIAPAVVRAESLMKMVRRESGLVAPEWVYPDMDAEVGYYERVRWVIGPQLPIRLGDRVWRRRALPFVHPSGKSHEWIVTVISKPDELLREFPSARSLQIALPSTS